MEMRQWEIFIKDLLCGKLRNYYFSKSSINALSIYCSDKLYYLQKSREASLQYACVSGITTEYDQWYWIAGSSVSFFLMTWQNSSDLWRVMWRLLEN